MGSLTKFERSVVTGSILGDGYLRIIPGRSNAFLEINHSIKAKDYADFKFQSLKRLCLSFPKKRKSNGNRFAYRFFTRQHKDLTEFYKKFYKNGIKIIPKDLELNPTSLAIWYMDDGSKSGDNIYLNSQQFSLKDQNKLLICLKKFGISATLNKDKKYYRIRIINESVRGFMKIIKPHITNSMKYKLVMTP